MTDSLNALSQALDYTFTDLALLRLALTPAASLAARDNERLEFLGDRVAGLVIAKALYDTYPEEAEGDLAKRHAALVQGSVMADVARELGLQTYLETSFGVVPDSFLADAMEAVIGAIYLDGGMDAAAAAVMAWWGTRIRVLQAPPQDPKTALQEWAQARGIPTPVYDIVDRSGPDHAPVFTVRVMLRGQPPMTATGKSRREAEKLAATDLLQHVEGQKK